MAVLVSIKEMGHPMNENFPLNELNMYSSNH